MAVFHSKNETISHKYASKSSYLYVFLRWEAESLQMAKFALHLHFLSLFLSLYVKVYRCDHGTSLFFCYFPFPFQCCFLESPSCLSKLSTSYSRLLGCAVMVTLSLQTCGWCSRTFFWSECQIINDALNRVMLTVMTRKDRTLLWCLQHHKWI